MAAKINVKKSEGEYVCPSEETPSGSLCLSELDHYAWLYLPILWVYEGSSSKSCANPCNLIKESVARALVYFYPLAGRLRLREYGEGKGRRYEVLCNGEGALFIEAESSCTLKDVKYLADEQALPASVISTYVLPTISHELTLFQLPLVAIQVTMFGCGGFVFGMRISHILVDGVGIMHFLDTVSNIARGRRLPPSPYPVWERQQLACSNIGSYLRERPHGAALTRHNLSRTIFSISAKCIKELRRDIIKESNGDLNSCSSFESLCASIWISFRNSTEEEVLPPSFAVSARNLFPAMAQGFYGNCIVVAMVQSEDYDDKDSRELRRSDVIKALRRAKARITQEYVRTVIKELNELTAVDPKILNPFQGVMMLFSDWRFLGFSEPDFGWGDPILNNFYEPHSPSTILLPLVKRKTRALISLPPETRLSDFKSEMARLTSAQLSTEDGSYFTILNARL